MFDSTTARLAGFASALALVGAGAAAIGTAARPTPPLQDCLKVAAAAAGSEGGAMEGETGGEPMVEAIPGADGLRSELAGVRLESRSGSFAAGATTTWRFRLVDCDGNAVRDLEPENGKLLHLIVVRSDLTGYQHLHPALGPDGTWSIRVRTPRAGAYRAIADFVVDGRKYVLGTTLRAPGRSPDRPHPTPGAARPGRRVRRRAPATRGADVG